MRTAEKRLESLWGQIKLWFSSTFVQASYFHPSHHMTPSHFHVGVSSSGCRAIEAIAHWDDGNHVTPTWNPGVLLPTLCRDRPVLDFWGWSYERVVSQWGGCHISYNPLPKKRGFMLMRIREHANAISHRYYRPTSIYVHVIGSTNVVNADLRSALCSLDTLVLHLLHLLLVGPSTAPAYCWHCLLRHKQMRCIASTTLQQMLLLFVEPWSLMLRQHLSFFNLSAKPYKHQPTSLNFQSIVSVEHIEAV